MWAGAESIPSASVPRGACCGSQSGSLVRSPGPREISGRPGAGHLPSLAPLRVSASGVTLHAPDAKEGAGGVGSGVGCSPPLVPTLTEAAHDWGFT